MSPINPRLSYSNQRMAGAPDNTLVQATVIPQGVLDAYRAPSVGTHHGLPGHPVQSYPTPPSDPDNSTSIPYALHPGPFLLTGPWYNAYQSSRTDGLGHPLPEYSSATRPTAVAQLFTTSIPGPIFIPYGTSFDGHSLQDHPALVNPGQPPADSTVVAQSESLGMGSSSAMIPQGMASLVSAEDNGTPAGLASEYNGDESCKEKPPHHRSAKATHTSELREHVQNTRRSKAPNHPRPYKSKRTTPKQRAAPVSNVPCRAPHKISLEASQILITEWQRLNLEKSDFPVYDVVSPAHDKEHQGGLKWRCSFSDDKGHCDTMWRRRPEAERHSLTHHPIRWLCLNPSCGQALSREDAVERHYMNNSVCKSHLPARANLETGATTTGPVILLGANGLKLVQIRWVTASD